MTLGIQTTQTVVKMAKHTLKQVGETMFPGISESYNHNKPKFSSLPISKLGNEIVTDLPLQICLFFNLCYFPFWLIISIIIAYVKVLYAIKICNERIKFGPFGFLLAHQRTTEFLVLLQIFQSMTAQQCCYHDSSCGRVLQTYLVNFICQKLQNV